MDIKALWSESGLNIKLMLTDDAMRREFVREFVKITAGATVWFPSNDGDYGQIIKVLSEDIEQLDIIIGDELTNPDRSFEKVILFKKLFKAGIGIGEQVEIAKKVSKEVEVLCIGSHSGARMDGFAWEHEIKANVLGYLDEINDFC